MSNNEYSKFVHAINKSTWPVVFGHLKKKRRKKNKIFVVDAFALLTFSTDIMNNSMLKRKKH